MHEETQETSNNAAQLHVVSVLGKVVKAKSYQRKDEDGNPSGKFNMVLDIADPINKCMRKTHIPVRVLAQNLFDEADHAVTPANLVSKGISFDYHQKGDQLKDETTCTSDGTLVNINTIMIMDAEMYKEVIADFK